jgi:hypothetical protein
MSEINRPTSNKPVANPLINSAYKSLNQDHLKSEYKRCLKLALGNFEFTEVKQELKKYGISNPETYINNLDATTYLPRNSSSYNSGILAVAAKLVAQSEVYDDTKKLQIKSEQFSLLQKLNERLLSDLNTINKKLKMNLSEPRKTALTNEQKQIQAKLDETTSLKKELKADQHAFDTANGLVPISSIDNPPAQLAN